MPAGAFVLLLIWVGMAVGFGLWMLIWPKHYWKTWKSYLKNGDPFESAIPGRTAALKAYVNRSNPIRRARVMGAIFILAGLSVGAILAFGALPLK